MSRLFALLAALALLACGQPEPWAAPKDHDLDGFTPGIDDFESVSFQVQIAAKPGETLTDRTDRALDRLRYLLGPSEAHAQLFPSTLTDTLRLGKGRYKLVQVESAQSFLVEKFFLGPTSTRPTCNAARSGLFHINAARQVSYCNSAAWVPIGGVLRQATPPTCSDSQPVRLYEDSDDNGLYRCVGTTWTKVADDGDLDGFASDIDADDADDAVYARNLTAAVVQAGTDIGPSGDVILTGTLRYEDITTYSGNSLNVNGDGRPLGSRPSDNMNSLLSYAFKFCSLTNSLMTSVESTTTTTNNGFSFYGTARSASSANFVNNLLTDTSTSSGSASTTVFGSINCRQIGG